MQEEEFLRRERNGEAEKDYLDFVQIVSTLGECNIPFARDYTRGERSQMIVVLWACGNNVCAGEMIV